MDYAKKYRLDLQAGKDYTIREHHSLAVKLGSEIVVIGKSVYCKGSLKVLPHHEYLHIAQFKKYGKLRVFFHYWFFVTINLLKYGNFKKAFEMVPFEQEARAYEKSKL